MSAETMNTDASKEKLVADVKVLVADTEELLRATASQAGEKAVVARERYLEQMRGVVEETISAPDGTRW